MKYKTTPPEFTYENLLTIAKLPLSALSAERLARILRNNFGARTVTPRQFKAALRRYHAGVAIAEQQYIDETQTTEGGISRADYRNLSPNDKLAIRYRVAEGQNSREIAFELAASEDAFFKITEQVRDAVKAFKVTISE